MENDASRYIARGTLQTCPFSKQPTIMTSFDGVVKKEQCPNYAECKASICPLEEKL